MSESATPITLAFVRGTSPSKWVKRWHDAFADRPLELLPLPLRRTSEIGTAEIDAAGMDIKAIDALNRPASESDTHRPAADIALLRCDPDTPPAGTTGSAPFHHGVKLYEEAVALVTAPDHELASHGEIDAEDLQLVTLSGHPDHARVWPGPTPDHVPGGALRDARQAMEVAASGATCALLPLPLARQLAGKDATVITVKGLAGTSIWAVWRRDRDDHDTQNLIGIMRGRGATSSRNAQRPRDSAPSRGAKKPRRG